MQKGFGPVRLRALGRDLCSCFRVSLCRCSAEVYPSWHHGEDDAPGPGFLPGHKLLLRQTQSLHSSGSQDSPNLSEITKASSTSSPHESQADSPVEKQSQARPLQGKDVEDMEQQPASSQRVDREPGPPRPLHIVWPHR
ncbi:hypothetical protein NFI96_010296 [Prochilodus magdalenae]|nr:hypothetical protein NFI96_010296 [Prochilodus magdalenae]